MAGITGWGMVVDGNTATINSVTANANWANGTCTYTLNLNSASKAYSGKTVTYTYTAGTVVDAYGIVLANIGSSSVTNNSTQVANPTISSITVGAGGNTVTYAASAALTAGAGGTGGMAITASGGAVTLTYSSGNTTSSIVYSTSRIILQSESTSAGAYTQPGTGWQDGSANNLLTFTGATVTNSSTYTAPVLANASTLSYTSGQAATAINTILTVTDAGGVNLIAATITLTTDLAEDVLSFVPDGTFVVFSNSGGVLVLHGPGGGVGAAAAQIALRAVKYNNTNASPTLTARSVAFRTSDINGVASNTITSTINLALAAPVANAASFSVAKNGAYSGQLVATGGGSLTYSKVGDSSHGTTVVNSDGTFTYTPTTDYTGADSFTFKVNNGSDSNTATVTITVTAVIPPVTGKPIDPQTPLHLVNGNLVPFNSAAFVNDPQSPQHNVNGVATPMSTDFDAQHNVNGVLVPVSTSVGPANTKFS